MKRLDKHQSKDYGPTKVSPSDLRELVSILEGRTGLQLVADDIEFDSPDEFFAEYSGRIPSTSRIKVSEPYLLVEFSRLWTRLYVSSSDTDASGLFARLDAVLRRCERKPRALFNYWHLIAVFWLLQSLPYLPALNSYKTTFNWVLVVLATWFVWVMFLQVRRHALLQTDTANAKSFWQRNSDSVVVAIVAALIGAVGGAIATKLADRYSPNTPSQAATPAETTHQQTPEVVV